MTLPAGSEPEEVRSGSRLGRYEIVLPVAQGGMARVWAARQHGQRGFSKLVAIKTILPNLAKDPSFEAMFLDEAHLASGVHHPNVCEIFDLGEQDENLYLAMEWVNGEALSRILKPPVPKGQKAVTYPLEPRVAARIVADTAKGLHAAHELKDDSGQSLGLVHRDVSPQNILISIDGVVKVTDFGVAKALRTQHEATSAGQVKGKVAYMSPEQARGGKIDRRSDVYALGIVLYEATTGARPFQGEGEIEVLKALAMGHFAPPGSLVSGYPPELEGIVMVALSMDPSLRFPSADSMRLALEEWLARSGPVVTEAQVAETVRARAGRQIEERVARIRERTRVAAPEASSPVHDPPPPPLTPAAGEASASQAGLQSGVSNISLVSYVSHASAPSHVSTVGPGSAPSQVSTVGPGSAPSHVSTVGPGSAPSNISQFSPVVQTAPGNSAAAKTALLGVAIGVGVFALAAVGGGYWLLRGKSNATTRDSTSLPVAVTEGSISPAVEAEVKVRLVEPKSGVTFLLDGVVQPVGRLSFEKPKPGSVKVLTARSEGYQDAVIRIDGSTDVIEVALKKQGAEDGKPAQPGAREKATASQEKPTASQDKPLAVGDKGPKPPEPKPASGGSKPPENKPKPKAGKPDIPDNPF